MTSEPGWLLLIHQIPQNPGYLRVKVWRRLQRVGAVAIKSSVYVLPASEQAREDFEWTLREIVQGGGDASICEARFVEGLGVEQVEALFHAARDADYAQIAEEAREVGPATEMPSAAELARLRRRLEEVSAIDFFGAPGRALAEAALLSAEARVRSTSQSDPPDGRETDHRCRTWVTRKGIHVDRMASAWLIRKFIDPEARFKFVAGQVGGHGDAEAFARGVRHVWDAMRAVRRAQPEPATTFPGEAPVPGGSLDADAIGRVIGEPATTDAGVVKITLGRDATMHGSAFGKSMGLTTWAAFTGSDAHAAIDGDFAMTADEVQPVLRALRRANIHVVALHNHMVGETPIYFFTHFWAKGPAIELARGFRGALDAQWGVGRERE